MAEIRRSLILQVVPKSAQGARSGAPGSNEAPDLKMDKHCVGLSAS